MKAILWGVILGIEVLALSACGAESASSSASPTVSRAATHHARNTSTSATSSPASSRERTKTVSTSTPPAACSVADLHIALVHTGVAAGTEGGEIRFTNTSTAVCSLHGWPTVVGVTAQGVASAPATNFDGPILGGPGLPNGPLQGIPTVSLKPGQSVEATVAGNANPPGNATSCPPPYRTLRITPPGSSQTVTVSAWLSYADAYFPSCASLEVTMVAPTADFG